MLRTFVRQLSQLVISSNGYLRLGCALAGIIYSYSSQWSDHFNSDYVFRNGVCCLNEWPKVNNGELNIKHAVMK